MKTLSRIQEAVGGSSALMGGLTWSFYELHASINFGPKVIGALALATTGAFICIDAGLGNTDVYSQATTQAISTHELQMADELTTQPPIAVDLSPAV